MKKSKKIILIALDAIMIILYLYLGYCFTSMFSFMPWYDINELYLINLIGIWLPISFATIINILVKLIMRCYDKAIFSLACLNAIYIPILFGLGFISVPFWLTKTIGAIAIITIITYTVLCVRYLIKNK